MRLLRVERRSFSGGGANWTNNWPADGTIPPNWWGATTNASGQAVNQDSALRLTAVWACVSLVSDYIAGLPVQLVTPDGKGGVRQLPTPDLLVDPWPGMTRFEWFFQMQSSLMLRGNAYGLKHDFDSRGYPHMIQPLNPDKVAVRFGRGGQLEYQYDNKSIPAEEMFHQRAFFPCGTAKGLSPIESFAGMLGVQLAVEEFGAQWFGDGAHPTSVLQYDGPVNSDQAKTVKQRIMEAFRGNREPLVLGDGAKWVPIQVNPNESQFLETMKFGVNQVARIFRVPSEMVGGSADGSAVTYANTESRDLTLQTYGIMPWTERWGQSLTPLVGPRPSYIRFDLEAKLRADTASLYQAIKTGITGGFLCADDGRHKLGLDDVPDGLGKQFLWPPDAKKFPDTEADPLILGDEQQGVAPTVPN